MAYFLKLKYIPPKPKHYENYHNNYPAHVHDDRYFRPGEIRQSKE